MSIEDNKYSLINWKNINIPTIAITGGKGGTGKTTIAINLAFLFAQNNNVLLIDLDVDAPNTAILLNSKLKKIKDVINFLPKFIEDNCVSCGLCSKACREHAILNIKGKAPLLLPELCSGCGACKLVCKNNAIMDDKKIFGSIHIGKINENFDLLVGELKLREARSAEVIKATKSYALELIDKNKYDIIIIDTSPGAHCDVLRALYGIKNILCVTEPTPFGVHDLERIIKLIQHIKMAKNVKIILNRADLVKDGNKIIENISKKYFVEIISRIPIDIAILKSYSEGIPVVKKYPDSPSAKSILELYKKLEGIICQ